MHTHVVCHNLAYLNASHAEPPRPPSSADGVAAGCCSSGFACALFFFVSLATNQLPTGCHRAEATTSGGRSGQRIWSGGLRRHEAEAPKESHVGLDLHRARGRTFS